MAESKRGRGPIGAKSSRAAPAAGSARSAAADDESLRARVIEGGLVIPPRSRFAIVASRFNHFIVDRLVEGALDAIARHGGDPDAATIVRVPGAWEIPAIVNRLAKASMGAGGAGRVDAIIALGAVIRGSTPHFDYVAAEVSKGVAAVSLDTGVPVSFGILTTDSIEQAVERAGSKSGNKGWEAALSAIEMVALGRALDAAGL